jgi:Fic family protein
VSFQAFWKDMGETYSTGLTLDRIDNSQGYEKSNCRWVGYRTQANNRRGNVLVDTPKGKMTISQASRVFGIGKTTIHYRLKTVGR